MKSRIVTDLVLATIEAAAQAIVWHLQMVQAKGKGSVEAIADALDFGYDADLEDYTHADQKIGFDHAEISSIFWKKYVEYKIQNQLAHIGSADEEKGIFSLNPRSADRTEAPNRRTRASALVQQAFKAARGLRSRPHATTKTESSAIVTVPSPLWIAYQLLSDPNVEPSRVYASSALIQLLLEFSQTLVEGSSKKSADIDGQIEYKSLSSALSTIKNRSESSKAIQVGTPSSAPTYVFVCNLLAMQGQLGLRISLGSDSLAALADRPLVTIFGANKNIKVSYWADPLVVEFPEPGDILNLTNGLPLPIEGAEIIFSGGLRYSHDGSLVAAVSGPFGAGKTSFCLSIAAALAPLGCRTLYLSCEEDSDDAGRRLLEAAPDSIDTGAQLFRRIRPNSLLKDDEREPWFAASELRAEDSVATEGEQAASAPLDPAPALSELVQVILDQADLFAPFRNEEANESLLPTFARPVIVIDGLHQLFGSDSINHKTEKSLQRLVETCRKSGAVVIFTVAEHSPILQRLDFLCDVVMELDRDGFNKHAEEPLRVFRLLKARRQPAQCGTHLFSIHGPKGFRLKPTLSARTECSKRRGWQPLDDRRLIYLTDETPMGFQRHLRSSVVSRTTSSQVEIITGSQILVVGKGSSGKAGFGLYLLHRRPIDQEPLAWCSSASNQLELIASPTANNDSKLNSYLKSGLPVRIDSGFIESRVLVVSFLYPHSYYSRLASNLGMRAPNRRQTRMYLDQNTNQTPDFNPHADRNRIETISLYPGHLTPENLLSKVESRLAAAEFRGRPFSGVLIDGLHNIFVQYPVLERENSLWPELYSLLRRRQLTVVTTHTIFDLQQPFDPDFYSRDLFFSARDGSSQGNQRLDDYRKDAHGARSAARFLDLDFEHAQRRAAPLMSALVSASDYVFDLTAYRSREGDRSQLSLVSGLGIQSSEALYRWDRQRMVVH